MILQATVTGSMKGGLLAGAATMLGDNIDNMVKVRQAWCRWTHPWTTWPCCWRSPRRGHCCLALTRPVPTFGSGGSNHPLFSKSLASAPGDTGHAQAPAGGAHSNRDGRIQEGLLRWGEKAFIQVISLLSADPTALMQMAMADNAIQGALLTCVVTYLRLASKCRLSIFPSILFRGQGLQVKGAWTNCTWFLMLYISTDCPVWCDFSFNSFKISSQSCLTDRREIAMLNIYSNKQSHIQVMANGGSEEQRTEVKYSHSKLNKDI